MRDEKCWRGECRTSCYYPASCSDPTVREKWRAELPPEPCDPGCVAVGDHRTTGCVTPAHPEIRAALHTHLWGDPDLIGALGDVLLDGLTGWVAERERAAAGQHAALVDAVRGLRVRFEEFAETTIRAEDRPLYRAIAEELDNILSAARPDTAPDQAVCTCGAEAFIANQCWHFPECPRAAFDRPTPPLSDDFEARP